MQDDESMFRINVLSRLSKISRDILEITKVNDPTSIRAYEATRIFEKATLHSISFLKLWPLDNKNSIEIDTASLATIARVIMENHNVLHYLTEHGLSKDEFEFRSLVMRLHYSKKIKEILQKLQFEESDGINRVFSMSESSSIRLLRDNQLFKLLSMPEQLKILKGKEAYLKERITSKRNLLEADVESGIYNLLSNSVHSYPLGLMNASLGINDNHLNGFNLLYISLEVSILYFSSLIIEYLKLRRKIFMSISKEDRDFVKDKITSENIMRWIDDRRNIGKNLIF